jgi:hypothetical protein
MRQACLRDLPMLAHFQCAPGLRTVVQESLRDWPMLELMMLMLLELVMLLVALSCVYNVDGLCREKRTRDQKMTVSNLEQNSTFL